MCIAVKNLEVVILPLTYRCNAKCAMCGIGDLKEWDELSLEKYETIFKESVWSSNVRSVNITGGEPFLRKDIVELTRLLLNNTKKIDVLVVNTNGIMTEAIIGYVKKVIPMCKRERNVNLKIYISLDGIGKSHDKIRKVSQCFEKVNHTIQKLNQLKRMYDFDIVINCTVTKDNYKNVYDVYEYACNNGVEINYTYAMVSQIYFQNKGKVTDLKKSEKEYFINFLRMFVETEEGAAMSSYYRNLIRMLEGEYRQVGCIFQEKGVFIHPNGNIFRCWVHDKKIGNIKNNTLSEIWAKQNEKCTVNDIKKKCQSCFNNCYQEYQRVNAIHKMLYPK